jgi:hypothetical protein
VERKKRSQTQQLNALGGSDLKKRWVEAGIELGLDLESEGFVH